VFHKQIHNPSFKRVEFDAFRNLFRLRNKYTYKNTIDSFNKISMVFLFVIHLILFLELFQKTFLPNFVPVENFNPLQILVLLAFLFIFNYSHSIVPGGFGVTSYTTRLTPGTSLVMRLLMRCSRS
jgi:hypothetical protein